MTNSAREGVIIECPLNDLFHELVIDVLTSRTDVSEVVENVDNVLTVIYSSQPHSSEFGVRVITKHTNIFYHMGRMSTFFVRITTSNVGRDSFPNVDHVQTSGNASLG